MKKGTCIIFMPLLLAIIRGSGIFAQNTISNISGSMYIQCAEFHETIAVKDMPDQTEEQKDKAIKNSERFEKLKKSRPSEFLKSIREKEQSDPVVQTIFGNKPLPAPVINFDGQETATTCPPDPDGAVGLTQYVQAINTSFEVFDKTGKALTGKKSFSSLFSGANQNDLTDPIVLYDKFADRWFLSILTFTFPVELLVAVSQTGDATGKYYAYKFTNSIWDTIYTPHCLYPDYPKYSIWSDGYYMTGQWYPSGLVVLDRARMIAGKASAGMIMAATPSPPTYFGAYNSFPSAAKILDCDASALPPYGVPNYMVFFENINSGGYSDKIVFYKVATDTANKTVVVSRWDSLSPAAFNAYFDSPTSTDIPQPDSNDSLDALDGTFNFRVPFLEFTGYNSVMLCNTVNTGGRLAGIRWYEIRQEALTQHFSIYQQGTYAPADGVSRWNASIGMDQDGDIALSYNVSSSSLYPGICYTGRLSTDKLDTMTGVETTVISGSKPSVNCYNRWGDYSEMTLDPSNSTTFWNTNEYDKAGAEASRIFSFNLSGVSGFANPIDLAEFKVYQSGNYLNITVTALPSNDAVHVDLFNVIGKLISGNITEPWDNAIQTKISISGLPNGEYFVRIGNNNYQRVVKVLKN